MLNDLFEIWFLSETVSTLGSRLGLPPDVAVDTRVPPDVAVDTRVPPDVAVDTRVPPKRNRFDFGIRDS